jgi:FkbM family methyltransferase
MMSWLKRLKQHPAIGFLKNTYIFIIYRLFKKPYGQSRITLQIDGTPSFDIDYSFGPCKYEDFGRKHNIGFQHWLKACEGKSVVFDVGAHIGLYSLPASRVVAPRGRIYAFEPSQSNREFFNKHIAYNKCQNIVVEPYLVGESDAKEVEFYENEETDPMNALMAFKNSENYRKVLREQVSLDSFCQKNNLIPEVMKIDVEGAEVLVLKGAQEILRKYQPLIFLSVHPSRIEKLGNSLTKLKELIWTNHYLIQDFDNNIAKDLVFGEYILTQKG